MPGENMTVSEIDSRLEALDRQFQELLAKATEDGADVYTDNFRSIMEKTTALKERRKAIETQRNENTTVNQQIQRAVSALENASAALLEWDEPTIRQLVDTVKVISADEIIVYLQSGAEIHQNIIK